MGQTTSSRHNYIKNKWEYVDSYGRFQIYKNQDNQLAEKHIVRANPKIQQDDYLNIYKQRNLPNKPIVNVYDAIFSQKDNDVCRNSSVLTVYTEYIPYRLSNVNKLTQGQGMYVLSEALAGFSELYKRVGSFQINEDLIGFNKDGEVKVWHNTNFAQNAVDNDRVILMSTRNPFNFDNKFIQNQQFDMVEDVFGSVAKYTSFNPNFLSQLQHVRGLGFNQARELISNEINKKAYYVPDHINFKGSNSILLKSGVRSKYQVNANNRQVSVIQRESYPFFVGNQSHHTNTRFVPEQSTHINYRPVETISRPYDSKIIHQNMQSYVVPTPINSYHLIQNPPQRVTYTTQESIVHQLPVTSQVRQHYRAGNERQAVSPRGHRHKIFQQPTMIRQV